MSAPVNASICLMLSKNSQPFQASLIYQSSEVQGTEGHRYSGHVPHVPLVHYVHALECWVSDAFWLLPSRRSEDLHMKLCLLLD